jgi:hypothetical protein
MSGVTEVKITDVKAICTAPEGIRLMVVKVETLPDKPPGGAQGGVLKSEGLLKRSVLTSESEARRRADKRKPKAGAC